MKLAIVGLDVELNPVGRTAVPMKAYLSPGISTRLGRQEKENNRARIDNAYRHLTEKPKRGPSSST